MGSLQSETIISNLISGINEVTDNSDTDLTSAVKSLIAGYGTGGGITPTGSINITQNGTYDVASKATAVVNVPASGGDGGIDMSVTPNQIKMLVLLTDITLEPYVNYVQSIANDVTVDWGDGSATSRDTRTGTERSSCAGVSHTYSSAGVKVITLTKGEGALSLVNNNGFLSFAGAYSTVNGNQYPNNGKYRNCLIQVAIGSDCLVGTGIDSCAALQEVIGMQGGANYMSNNLQVASMRDTDTVCVNVMGNTRVESVAIPASITTINTNSFRSCTNLRYVDFTAVTLVNGALPITFGTNVFTGIASNAVLMFATTEIANVAKTTTNLASYASLIHALDE